MQRILASAALVALLWPAAANADDLAHNSNVQAPAPETHVMPDPPPSTLHPEQQQGVATQPANPTGFFCNMHPRSAPLAPSGPGAKRKDNQVPANQQAPAQK